VHLVGFIIEKFVTMHGHTNVKKKHISILHFGDRTCIYTILYNLLG